MLGIVLGAFVVMALGWALWRWERAKTTPGAAYVGVENCLPCHAEQGKTWGTSHHAQAMQRTTDSTVLGNFNDKQFTNEGVTSTFFKKDGKFYVRTEGVDRKPQNYELLYTLGVYPLQQYLISVGGGRMQSFAVAWDSRAAEHGGQRWFQLYPSQKTAHTDVPQSARRDISWNYKCADCHSTNLQKNYDLAKDVYDTKWSSMNVSCEACHGPGSNHLAWARTHKLGSSQGKSGSRYGLMVDLRPTIGSWSSFNSESGTKYWEGSPRSPNQLNTCSPCHSRRRAIVSDPQPGQPFLDAYVPSLLEQGVYYADGQVLDDDYQWGSFVQSTMYQKQVTCSDCHDPHSGKLSQETTNALCGQCHSLAKFGNPAHHHHKPGSDGALCVNCHMPTRSYMMVGVEHDHSFRVPRPDLSITYGTPNTCNQCHENKSNSWAAETIVKWYGYNSRPGSFVEAIDALRRGLLNAENELMMLIINPAEPAIARATALSMLPRYLSPYSFSAFRTSLQDDDPLVRREATRALPPLTLEDRAMLGIPLLTDPVRAVRIEAARALAGTPASLSNDQKAALDRAISELIASEMASSERPQSHMDLALLYAQMGRVNDAETELKTALRLDPNLVPAMVRLAELYGAENRDEEGQRWLEKAIAAAPNAAEPIHALALSKIKLKQYSDVMSLLAKAAILEPDNLRYSYVYAVALNSSGHTDQAIAILEQAHRRYPADRQMLIGLIAFERDRANLPSAIAYARQLVELSPRDSRAIAMLSELTIANDPDTYQYWLIQGDASYKKGDLPGAQAAFRKGMGRARAELERNPRRAYTHAFVAYFAARLGDKATAEQEIRQARELSVNEDEIVRRMALTYEALGERDRAIEVLSWGSLQLLYDMNRQPELPELRDDPRFQKLLGMTQKGSK